MFRNIIITLLLFVSTFLATFFIWSNVSADSLKVENIFVDINSDYKYLNELQTLYDKWIITPDSEWKFNPKKLLTRAEFVWILMEVTCKDCIQPYTSNDLITKYKDSQVFYDIKKNNKYFYCVEEANYSWFVKWYYPWTTCEDWTVKDWEKPFCPSNTITLEEAIAVILRASWILTNVEAEKIRTSIYNWEITKSISEDVHPKNEDGSVYSFYPDLAKALSYTVPVVDINWNEVEYTLIKKENWKIRPKQAISKEKFLHIAYVALKASQCPNNKTSNLALKINIYDKSCTIDDSKCNLSDLNAVDNTYDFWNDVNTTCSEWINNDTWYIWRFYNSNTWNQVIKYGRYQDNYKFLSNWKWEVFLRVIDKCWWTGEVHNTIYVSLDNKETDKWFWLEVSASPLTWPWPLGVDFEAKPDGWKWPYECVWDYWDGSKWTWITPKHIFINAWTYEVLTSCTDSTWLKSEAKAIIYVTKSDTDLKVTIDANPISWEWPLLVNFKWIVTWWFWPYSYFWDFGDWNNWYWKNIENIFKQEWIYETKLIVTDSSWKQVTATVLVQVIWEDCNMDSDNDWVNNCDDVMPLVPWDERNKWAPILEKECNNSKDCKDWYICSEENFTCQAKTLTTSCEYTWWDVLFWNVICKSCPCNNYLDFISTLRKCDIIFPAITSPDFTKIYWKWELFQIK